MEHSIRPYQHKDFAMIESWWTAYNEVAPIEGMMIEDGTFVLDINSTPALSVTVYLTQSKEIAYLECFIKNPKFKTVPLQEYSSILLNHCLDYVKARGYKRVIALSYNNKVTQKYISLGMTATLNNLTSFVKEV